MAAITLFFLDRIRLERPSELRGVDPRAGAEEIAHRIGAALEADDLLASPGVAELPPGGTAIDLRERADTAMYTMKARRKTLRLV